jgi:uncharacterized glyoxalase superfamily protein PhnB
MTKSTNPIPPGQQVATPHLVIKHTDMAIEFYKRAFGAVEMFRFAAPDGRVMHADITIGGSHIFLSDEFPEHGGCLSPSTLHCTNATIHLFVEDVDQAYGKAVAAGAVGIMAPQDMFWGNRFARLIDPFGQPWSMATHTEDLTAAEIELRGSEFF